VAVTGCLMVKVMVKLTVWLGARGPNSAEAAKLRHVTWPAAMVLGGGSALRKSKWLASKVSVRGKVVMGKLPVLVIAKLTVMTLPIVVMQSGEVMSCLARS